jgi:hypothetical protein
MKAPGLLSAIFDGVRSVLGLERKPEPFPPFIAEVRSIRPVLRLEGGLDYEMILQADKVDHAIYTLTDASHFPGDMPKQGDIVRVNIAGAYWNELVPVTVLDGIEKMPVGTSRENKTRPEIGYRCYSVPMPDFSQLNPA